MTEIARVLRVTSCTAKLLVGRDTISKQPHGIGGVEGLLIEFPSDLCEPASACVYPAQFISHTSAGTEKSKTVGDSIHCGEVDCRHSK